MDAAAVMWLVVGVLALVVFLRLTRAERPEDAHRPTSTIGAGAVGTIYDMLNEDKRRAVDVIVEGRAAAHDPEDKDGNLPDLGPR